MTRRRSFNNLPLAKRKAFALRLGLYIFGDRCTIAYNYDSVFHIAQAMVNAGVGRVSLGPLRGYRGWWWCEIHYYDRKGYVLDAGKGPVKAFIYALGRFVGELEQGE